MDKRQAQQSINELFTQPFNAERYQRFLSNLLNKYEIRDGHYTGNYIPDAFKQYIKQYWRIGKYIDPEGDELDLLVVEVKSLNKLERARSMLRNFAVNRLKKFEKEASLIAFYAEDDQGDDWRFSFVKIEHEAYKDDKGKVKLKQELTPAKRYSYLVGVHENSHTASKQLLPLLEMAYADPRIEEIEAAFSIEKVTDEFFDQYKALFLKLAEHLKRQAWFKKSTEAELDQRVTRFAKKLLGQIVFLYFLQKKGWLGVPKDGRWGEGLKRFMRERHDQVTKAGRNYYRDFLQYLFYEALADERKGQSDPGYYQRFNCRVPFLNGGLFEADYDWRNEVIELPNSLFHNDEKTKAGDAGTGILDVFDRYNFTIKEDEPLEKEVAVDPEMLGKVFENMLEVSERKSKGAFYTPREIVHYMCQESLIHYLDNHLNVYAAAPELSDQQGDIFDSRQQSLGGEVIKVPQADLETLIRKGHLAQENDAHVITKGKETDTYRFQLPESVRQHAKAIDEALADIKVCDPAIGSGAFPVGMLHEIINARMALALHSGIEQSTYELKRHAIGESIYGVDIDASAIDIARLRLWLSLIVDEEDYGQIEALPNLDYKIVRGDSLLGIDDIGKNDDIFNPKFSLISELEQAKQNFFSTSDHESKGVLSRSIGNLIHQITDGKEAFDFKIYFSEAWHYKDGFDIVIGNPPYGASLAEEHKKVLVKRFSHIVDRIRNSFLYFMGLSEALISPKGVAFLIIPNEFLFQIYMGKARAHFLSNRRILSAINIGESAFKAVVPTCIIAFDSRQCAEYEIPVHDFRHLNLKGIENALASGNPMRISNKSILGRPNQTFSFDRKLDDLTNKLSSQGQKLENFCVDIANGISTSCDSIYVVPKSVAVQRDFEIDYLKPTLKGKDIGKFDCPNEPEKYILYVDNEFNEKSARNIYDYLLENKDLLIQKSVEKKSGTREWYLLFRARYKELFISPKILVRQTGDSVIAAWDEAVGYFCIDSVNVVQLKPQFRNAEMGRHILGILNSQLINFYYQQISQEAGRVMAQVKPSRLRELPIVTSEHSPIWKLVGFLEFLTVRNLALQKAFFEDILNGHVYELYFPSEVSAAHKQILPFIVDLKPITSGMTDEEKLAVIQSEFDRLYDPRHPVRNHLETLDSVEVVRTIREALQKK